VNVTVACAFPAEAVTPVGASGTLFTVTAHVAVKPPSVVVTVIVALPADTAVTRPLELTVATPSALELHVTF
jgi:hypothetical protein